MKIKLFLVSILALVLVSGCEEKKPSIATTVYPVQYLVKRIGGEDVTVTNITENTMIQRAQIKASFKDTLEDSDALFYIGGLEPYMDLYERHHACDNGGRRRSLKKPLQGAAAVGNCG